MVVRMIRSLIPLKFVHSVPLFFVVLGYAVGLMTTKMLLISFPFLLLLINFYKIFHYDKRSLKRMFLFTITFVMMYCVDFTVCCFFIGLHFCLDMTGGHFDSERYKCGHSDVNDQEDDQYSQFSWGMNSILVVQIVISILCMLGGFGRIYTSLESHEPESDVIVYNLVFEQIEYKNNRLDYRVLDTVTMDQKKEYLDIVNLVDNLFFTRISYKESQFNDVENQLEYNRKWRQYNSIHCENYDLKCLQFKIDLLK